MSSGLRVVTATAEQAMVVGMGDPRAGQSGLNVIRRGGNALDAVLTSAITSIALTAGVAVSTRA